MEFIVFLFVYCPHFAGRIFSDLQVAVLHHDASWERFDLFGAGVLNAFVKFAPRKGVRKSHYEDRGATHCYAGPHRRYCDIETIEHASNNRHHSQVVQKGPEQIELNETIAFLEQIDEGDNLVQILRQHDHIRSINVQYDFAFIEIPIDAS